MDLDISQKEKEFLEKRLSNISFGRRNLEM